MDTCDEIILITGVAGFVGFHIAKRLLETKKTVIGVDNINDYYDVSLKGARLNQLYIYERFTFLKGDISDFKFIERVLKEYRPSIIINLAAQAGVRYSIENPESYINSNIKGFFNILEGCKRYTVKHLIFASSSSVYGLNKKIPFTVEDKVDCPASLYAATKKSNELMAYSYSHLYGIPITGVRFFTVYGPYGRPDMAYFSFAEAIMKESVIKIYNHGDMYRDFTYIDDVVEYLYRIIYKLPDKDFAGVSYKVYNIGNNKPVKLTYFIDELEKNMEKKAIKEYLPMQAGDVYQTYADMSDTIKELGYQTNTSIEDGLRNFVAWYKEYRNIF